MGRLNDWIQAFSTTLFAMGVSGQAPGQAASIFKYLWLKLVYLEDLNDFMHYTV